MDRFLGKPCSCGYDPQAPEYRLDVFLDFLRFQWRSLKRRTRNLWQGW